MKFKVSVEKIMYATGAVVVEAENEDKAVEMVREQIQKGELSTTSVEWDEPVYEDGTFDATEDVEYEVDED